MTVRPRNIDLTNLPNIFPNRKFIIVTARSVAMGSASNFILKGMIEYLLNAKNAIHAKTFFSEFVLIFLPFLNIDGVKAG